MKTLKTYLLALTLLVASLTFAACGNNNGDTDTDKATTMTEEASTGNGANSGIINDTTDNNNATDKDGVVDDIGNDVKDGVDDVIDDMEGNTNNNNNNNNNNNANNNDSTNNTTTKK